MELSLACDSRGQVSRFARRTCVVGWHRRVATIWKPLLLLDIAQDYRPSSSSRKETPPQPFWLRRSKRMMSKDPEIWSATGFDVPKCGGVKNRPTILVFCPLSRYEHAASSMLHQQSINIHTVHPFKPFRHEVTLTFSLLSSQYGVKQHRLGTHLFALAWSEAEKVLELDYQQILLVLWQQIFTICLI